MYKIYEKLEINNCEIPKNSTRRASTSFRNNRKIPYFGFFGKVLHKNDQMHRQTKPNQKKKPKAPLGLNHASNCGFNPWVKPMV